MTRVVTTINGQFQSSAVSKYESVVYHSTSSTMFKSLRIQLHNAGQ